MPQHKSAIKRLRQNKKRRNRNQSKRSKISTLMSAVLNEGDKETAQKKYKEAISFLDKASNKRILHPNNAARKKSRLTNYINNL